jgi:hypothetical protein
MSTDNILHTAYLEMRRQFNMSKTRRSNWLLLPIVFGITFRIVLWLYWMPERNDWIHSHDNKPDSVAYGEGSHDAMAIIATSGPWLLSFICCVIGSAPRIRGVIALGVIASLGTIIFAIVDVWLKLYFVNLITINVIATIVTCIVIVFYYTRHFRSRHSTPAA